MGQVNAGAELDVDFDIDPDLAIGSYTATLRAAVPDSATAQFFLPLDAQVDIVCSPPTWAFQPSDYEYTMTAVLRVSVDGVQTADPNDVIAAYVGSQIRGIGSPIYVPEVDSWLVFMNVHSNIVAGENVRFRVYDDSECRAYNSASDFIRFESDRRRGTPEFPILLEAEDAPPQDVQLVNLDEGWTWFSLSRVALDMSVFSVLADLNPSEGDLIKSQFGGFSVYDPTVGWVGSLTELDVRSSYAIRLSSSGTLQHEGTAADPMIPIPVVDGWNWIGYPLLNAEPVGTALGGLSAADGDVVKDQYRFSHYSANDAAWLGGLGTMEPGLGFRLYLDDAFLAAGGPSFQYQESTPLTLARHSESGDTHTGGADYEGLVLKLWPQESMSTVETVEPAAAKFDLSENLALSATEALENRPDWQIDFGYQHNMSVITSVELDGHDYDITGALLAAFVGDELRGVTELQTVGLGRHYAFLTVHSDGVEGETVRFKLYDPEGDEIVDVAESVTFRADMVTGTLNSPLMVHATSTPTGPQEPTLSYSLAPHFPNPVKAGDIAIRWSIPTQETVSLGIYDVQGREVERVVDGTMNAGTYVHSVDADRFSSGMYFYRIQAGDFQKVERVLVVQ